MLKKELREEYKKKRQELSKTKRKELSNKILTTLFSSIDLKGKTVSVFLPIERFNEIITTPILREPQIKCVLPIVLPNGKLKHLLYEDESQIKISDWGIPEPTFGKEIEVKEIDLVLVPLLAIDKKGYRLGYGKGFYDRFLSDCRSDCQFVGLNYHGLVTEITDIDKFDIPLHLCVSPNKIDYF